MVLWSEKLLFLWSESGSLGEKDLAEEVEIISGNPSASPTNFDVGAEKEYLKLKIRSLELEKEIKDADNEKLRLQIELAKIGG